jgi:hypothetical protein
MKKLRSRVLVAHVLMRAERTLKKLVRVRRFRESMQNHRGIGSARKALNGMGKVSVGGKDDAQFRHFGRRGARTRRRVFKS